MAEQSSYEVHLTGDATGGDAGVESPVRTDRIDFYDSGVWVDKQPGRDFYPYSNVQVIKQRPVDASGDAAASAERAGENPGEAASEREEGREDGDGMSVE